MNATSQSPSHRESDDKRFDSDVASAPLVLVKFVGAWCPPCRALQPTIDALAKERSDVLVLTVDVDENQSVAQRFAVRAVPTLIAFRDGAAIGRLVGNQPRVRINKLLEGD